MNYSYNNFTNPFARNYQAPNYNPSQYIPQQQQPVMPQPQVQQMPIQQPMAQPVQQPMQFEIPIQYVGSATLKEAEAYILMPNAKAIFIDKANGMVYEKICNNNGQSSINYFKQIQGNEETKPAEVVIPTPTIDTAEFVKKQDLNGFITVEQYNNVLYELNALKQQINASNNIDTTEIEPKKTKTKKAVNNNDADE